MIDRIILNAGGSSNFFHEVSFKNKNSIFNMRAWYLPKRNIYMVSIDGFKDIVYKFVPRENAPIKYFKLKNWRGHKNGYRTLYKGLDCYSLTFEEANDIYNEEKKLMKKDKAEKQ